MKYSPDSVFHQRSDRQGVEIASELLSPGQAGRIACVSGQYMTNLARSGQMWAIRTSLGWLFEEGAVRRYAKDRAKKLRDKANTIEEGQRRTVKEPETGGRVSVERARETATQEDRP